MTEMIARILTFLRIGRYLNGPGSLFVFNPRNPLTYAYRFACVAAIMPFLIYSIVVESGKAARAEFRLFWHELIRGFIEKLIRWDS